MSASAPTVGAESGEAEPAVESEALEGTVQLRLRVDLGTARPLPAQSTLRLELSDLTAKDGPVPLATHEVDVSTQHDIVEVAVPIDGAKLAQAERISLTGRIDGPTKMLSISMVPLLVAGPFGAENGFVQSGQTDTFELDLAHVPGYEKDQVPQQTSVPVVPPVRQVDTGAPTDVPGPQ